MVWMRQGAYLGRGIVPNVWMQMEKNKTSSPK